MAWYVIRTKANAERRVAEELGARGLSTYIPVEKRLKVTRNGRKKLRKVIETPVIPSYLFVSIDQDGGFRAAHETPGVEGFLVLRSTGQPVELPGSDVTRFRVAEAAGQFDHTTERDDVFCEGDRLSVVVGPFTGYKARFVTGRADERAEVLLQSLTKGGPEWPTVMRLDQFEKAA